jgi:hypothetical protein
MITGNWLKRFSRECQVHGMSTLGLKINHTPAKDRIHGDDLSEAPTAVKAITAFGQSYQGLNILARQLACGRKFLQLFFR